jgi:RNA polymerase sigma factor (sigma-70 family)
MADSATTRPSLLLRIRDPRDRQAWEEFVEIYAPLVYGFARKHGLQSADAADLTQEVLRSVAGAAGRLEYDPGRGSFRGWLFTVVRNRLRNFLAGQRRQCRGSGDPDVAQLLEAVPAPEEDDSALWDRDYEQRLFAWAAEQVRETCQETTWRAFWLTAVEGWSGKDAAAVLGISRAAVYLARRRVTLRLREQVQQLQADG